MWPRGPRVTHFPNPAAPPRCQRWSVYTTFRKDAEKRDFIVCGAGAGLASAFNAPIGGVLFSLEEGASHWHKALTWNAFFASITAAYMIDFILSGLNSGGELGRLTGDAMMNFGSFSTGSSTSTGGGNRAYVSWGIWELPMYIGLGVLGGLLGATFNAVNGIITSWRLKRLKAAGVGGPPTSKQPPLPTPSATDASLSGNLEGKPAPPRCSCLCAPARAWGRLPSATRAQWSRVGEVVALAAFVSTVAFFGPLFFGTCQGRPIAQAPAIFDVEEAIPSTWSSVLAAGMKFSSVHAARQQPDGIGAAKGGSASQMWGPPNPLSAKDGHSGTLVSFYCPSAEFNDLASLWFAPQEEAIRILFHFTAVQNNATASSDADADASMTPFPLSHLAFFFVAYTALMCITAGSAIASGLFIPTLLSGAALGRLAGEVFNLAVPGGANGNFGVDPGMYALVGSAAMLGGTTRMTISLAVILLECTGNLSYALPLTATLMAARWTGNLFNDGIYDMNIHLRQWPLLEERAERAVEYELRAGDVMTAQPLVFAELERVGRIADVLTRCEHNGAPTSSEWYLSLSIMNALHDARHSNFMTVVTLHCPRRLPCCLHRGDAPRAPSPGEHGRLYSATAACRPARAPRIPRRVASTAVG